MQLSETPLTLCTFTPQIQCSNILGEEKTTICSALTVYCSVEYGGQLL